MDVPILSLLVDEQYYFPHIPCVAHCYVSAIFSKCTSHLLLYWYFKQAVASYK